MLQFCVFCDSCCSYSPRFSRFVSIKCVDTYVQNLFLPSIIVIFQIQTNQQMAFLHQAYVITKMKMVPVKSVIAIAFTIVFCIFSTCLFLFSSLRERIKKHKTRSEKIDTKKLVENTIRRKRINSIIFSLPFSFTTLTYLFEALTPNAIYLPCCNPRQNLR